MLSDSTFSGGSDCPGANGQGPCDPECLEEWATQRYGDDTAATMCVADYHLSWGASCLACEFCEPALADHTTNVESRALPFPVT